MPWKDPAYKKEYMRAYSARPDQIAKRKAWSKANRKKHRGYYLKWEAKDPQHTMVQRCKHSAKGRGIEFTITRNDLVWPTHCPVLGVKLSYTRDKKKPQRDNYPTLDRWDNTKGYVPGNVFVISWRANRIKWHCSPDELEAVARYARSGLTIP